MDNGRFGSFGCVEAVRYFIVFFSVFFPGCVSIRNHKKGVVEAYRKGLERSAQFMSRYDCNDAKWLVRSEITGAELQELVFK